MSILSFLPSLEHLILFYLLLSSFIFLCIALIPSFLSFFLSSFHSLFLSFLRIHIYFPWPYFFTVLIIFTCFSSYYVIYNIFAVFLSSIDSNLYHFLFSSLLSITVLSLFQLSKSIFFSSYTFLDILSIFFFFFSLSLSFVFIYIFKCSLCLYCVFCRSASPA